MSRRNHIHHVQEFFNVAGETSTNSVAPTPTIATTYVVPTTTTKVAPKQSNIPLSRPVNAPSPIVVKPDPTPTPVVTTTPTVDPTPIIIPVLTPIISPTPSTSGGGGGGFGGGSGGSSKSAEASPLKKNWLPLILVIGSIFVFIKKPLKNK